MAAGEELYPLVAGYQPQPAVASKVTGMLLELDDRELLDLLVNPSALQEQVRCVP